MPSDAPDPNSLAATGRGHSITLGDVPEAVRRRYFVDGRGLGGLAYYIDATIPTPAFRDRGDRLTTPSPDPHAIRAMVAIATHRGWQTVLVRGDAEFRREAWLAGRLQDLDVRGYRPTARDLEDLQRRLAAQRPKDLRPRRDEAPQSFPGPRDRGLNAAGPRSRLNVIETVVRARVRDPEDQERIVANARSRLAGWLERGARFDEVAAPRHREPVAPRRGDETRERR